MAKVCHNVCIMATLLFSFARTIQITGGGTPYRDLLVCAQHGRVQE